jgi:hypothetical protein
LIRIELTLGVRGFASPSLETPSAGVLGVGGARGGDDFEGVEGFGTVGPADVDAGAADF